MLDWNKLVQTRLAGLTAPPDVKDEVIAELAAHLAECHARARAKGLSEEAAAEFAFKEVKDWRVLAAEIRETRVG